MAVVDLPIMIRQAARRHLIAMRERRYRIDAISDVYRDLTDIGVRAGLPLEWRLCPMCGEQSWVMTPHSGPCPLMIQHYQDLGIKVDAERNLAIRTGANIEQMVRDMTRRLMGEEEE